MYHHFPINKEHLKIRPNIVKRIVGIGLPMALQNCVESIGLLGVQGVVNTCGTNTMAAYTAAGKIDQLALMPLSSLGLAVSTYVGQNYGKGDAKRIHKGVRASVLQGIGIGLILTIIIFFGRSLFARLFVNAGETEVIAIAAEYLGIVSIFYLFAGLMYIFLNVFRGMGKMRISTASSFVNPLVKMAAAFLLNFTLGRTALWFAWPIGWIAALLIPAFSYFFGHAVEKSIQQK